MLIGIQLRDRRLTGGQSGGTLRPYCSFDIRGMFPDPAVCRTLRPFSTSVGGIFSERLAELGAQRRLQRRALEGEAALEQPRRAGALTRQQRLDAHPSQRDTNRRGRHRNNRRQM